MKLEGVDLEFTALPGAVPAFCAEVNEAQWVEACRAVREQGGKLVALWGTDARAVGRGFVMRMALAARDGLVVAALLLKGNSYPDVSVVFPAARRMQRATRDLLGITASGADDERKWLRHAAWEADEFPLRKDFVSGRRPHHEPSRDLNAGESAAPRVTGGRIPEQTTFGARQGAEEGPLWGSDPGDAHGIGVDTTRPRSASRSHPASGALLHVPPIPAPPLDAYPFVRVEGEGVHEIPVGPVHAGTIEPGHFRFSVVGETVLRLEERLGYKHKGIEKRFEAMTLAEGVRLAGRVSGDSTVAYAWAYSMAVECAAELTPPPRALWLRALALERERIANHLGDLGFLGNDAALAFGLAQFMRLKEDCLRTHYALFGHRYLMDVIVPGGVARDLAPDGMEWLRRENAELEKSVGILKSIYDEHAGLQDRFINCGIVTRELADRLGLTGVAARASGEAWDTRVEFPCIPYAELEVRMGSHRNGDVAARVAVRFEEIFESLRLIRLILDRLPLGEIAVTVPQVPAGRFGIGWIEGWRGDILVALESADAGRIARCHAHDPSWQNWPLLEHAVIGNIVPDFPLINKSFNLSYSGHDL